MRSHILLLGTLLVFDTLLYAAEQNTPVDAVERLETPISLSELATQADLVAVAQVQDTDYVYTRSFPSEGSAFLRILIAYKRDKTSEDIIEIYEKGLHHHECYFENPTVLEEGRRYLVFFRHDPQNPEYYRGLAAGCALEILVTDNNRYALKYPLEGIQLADNLDELVAKYDFRDNYALVSEQALSPVQRDDLLTKGLIIRYQGEFKYTHGIDLTAARNLMDIKALRQNRTD